MEQVSGNTEMGLTIADSKPTSSWTIAGYLFSLWVTPAPIEKTPPKALDESDFEIMDWDKGKEKGYVEEHLTLTPQLQQSLAYVPFFQEEENFTKDNVSRFFADWNDQYPDRAIDTTGDLSEGAQSIREHIIELGSASFIRGAGLHIFYSEKTMHIARQILGHEPKDGAFEKAMINWYMHMQS